MASRKQAVTSRSKRRVKPFSKKQSARSGNKRPPITLRLKSKRKSAKLRPLIAPRAKCSCGSGLPARRKLKDPRRHDRLIDYVCASCQWYRQDELNAPPQVLIRGESPSERRRREKEEKIERELPLPFGLNERSDNYDDNEDEGDR